MIQVGITGGIGSGKSTISRIFSNLGIPVYNSDIEAKRISNTDPEVIAQITQEFGSESYTLDGLNREFLAKQVFQNTEKLEILNGIIHPAVGKDYSNWVKAQQGKANYVLKEAAILFESGAYRGLDRVILVSAPVDQRINRVVNRDKVAKEEVMRRIKNQWNDEKKKELSQFEIQNANESVVLPQVLAIHAKLLTL